MFFLTPICGCVKELRGVLIGVLIGVAWNDGVCFEQEMVCGISLDRMTAEIWLCSLRLHFVGILVSSQTAGTAA
jgi:hypothetical protein